MNCRIFQESLCEKTQKADLAFACLPRVKAMSAILGTRGNCGEQWCIGGRADGMEIVGDRERSGPDGIQYLWCLNENPQKNKTQWRAVGVGSIGMVMRSAGIPCKNAE